MKMFFGNNHTVLNYIVLIFNSCSFYQIYFRVLGIANILLKIITVRQIRVWPVPFVNLGYFVFNCFWGLECFSDLVLRSAVIFKTYMQPTNWLETNCSFCWMNGHENSRPWDLCSDERLTLETSASISMEVKSHYQLSSWNQVVSGSFAGIKLF